MRQNLSLFKKSMILFSFIPLILSIGIVPGLSYASEYTDTPREQREDGFTPNEVQCDIGLHLIIRMNGKAACVITEKVDEWEDVKNAIEHPLLSCQDNFVFLEHPQTGAIICRGQATVQNFVDRGWTVLDTTPQVEPEIDQCRSGKLHVEAPTGAILCKRPSDVQRFIDAGWNVLDATPAFSETGAAQCNRERVAMSGDTTGTIKCVRSQSVDLFKRNGFTLVEVAPKAGDAAMFDLTGCRGGAFHLKNLSSGIISCVIQSNVPTYLDRGWAPLYDLPFMTT